MLIAYIFFALGVIFAYVGPIKFVEAVVENDAFGRVTGFIMTVCGLAVVGLSVFEIVLKCCV